MRKAKVALVGLGGWGGGAIRKRLSLIDTLELVSWFDADPERVAKFRNEMPIPPAGSWGEVLDNPEVEGAILIVPNHVHMPLAVEAACRGKHIYVEKPIANTLEETDAIIQACDNAGVVLQVGHNFRRFPGIRLMKKMIEDRKIGDVAMVEAHQSHRGGWGLTPEVWRWYADKCPGGPLNLLGVHQIDTLHYLLGPSAEVSAMTAKGHLPCETEEATQAIVRFASGVLGYIGDTYITPGKAYIAVYGTAGMLEYDFLNPRLMYFDVDSKGEEVPLERLDTVADEFREFGECIITGKRPETGGPEGRAAVAVMGAALESARTGKLVQI